VVAAAHLNPTRECRIECVRLLKLRKVALVQEANRPEFGRVDAEGRGRLFRAAELRKRELAGGLGRDFRRPDVAFGSRVRRFGLHGGLARDPRFFESGEIRLHICDLLFLLVRAGAQRHLVYVLQCA